MKHLRCLASWLLYWIGEGAFQFIDRMADADSEEPGTVFDIGYWVYQRAMCASSDLDTGECGIWSDASPE